MMRRVLCVWFPDWPIQRLRAARPELRERPIVLFEESPGGGRQVAYCSRQASGVTPGMPLAEARALLRQANFERHDPAADTESLQTLAAECQRFSPLVGAGEEASLLMDVTGCAHLFGGEQPLLRQVEQFATRSGLSSRTAIADTIGAAWGICRFGRAGVVLHDAAESALRGLPVAALRLPSPLVETLTELGIQTIGHLRALPRGSLASRFGATVANRLDQAFGQLAELIDPIRPVEAARAEWTFDEPATDRRLLELSFYRLIEQVALTLRERQQGVQRLTCSIDDFSFTVGTTGPTAAVPHLWELIRLHLERLALPRAVTRLEVRAVLAARQAERQQQMISGDRTDPREMRRLLDRLGSRLGPEALLRPNLVSDPLPEFACRFDSIFDQAADDSSPNSLGRFRPVRMSARPIPVEVDSREPDGPPIRFRWKTEDHTIRHPWGPERIASGWWCGKQIQRDYYRVETTTGARFWLFRTEGAWFLHGTFE
jgi:protein ImuB